MIDVISSNGWLKPALLAMEMSQMVTQAVWPTSSQLWQLPYFDQELIDKCKSVGVKEIMDLMNMEDKDRDEVLQMDESQLNQIADVCNKYPAIDMQIAVETNNPRASEIITVNITLTRDTEDEAIPPVYAPYYPLDKEEYWWVVIGAANENKLMAIKRLVIGNAASAKLNFSINESGDHSLKVYLICDSYLGVDIEDSLSLTVLPGETPNEEEQAEPMDT